MLRWAIRAVAANSYKNKAISESKRASSKANDAKRTLQLSKEVQFSMRLQENKKSAN